MTDQQQPRPPLWQAMQSVYYDTFSLCKSERQCRAAEIRAVANRIKPSSPCNPHEVREHMTIQQRCENAAWTERAKIYSEFLYEAQRAEAGE